MLETGVSPSRLTILAWATATTNKRWKTIVKTVSGATILMQTADDDFENLEKFKQEVLGVVGLKVRAQPISQVIGRKAQMEQDLRGSRQTPSQY